MKFSAFLKSAVLFFLFASQANSQTGDGSLIFPDPDNKILLVKSDKNAEGDLSGTIIPEKDPLGQRISAELSTPYHQSIIKLIQCSRNLAKDFSGPNILYLSDAEGGFPRKGITLRSDEGETAYPALNFVDLYITPKRLEGGAMQIYSHEAGHVMMNNIMPGFLESAGQKRSVKQHVSMGITDYYTAFFEGWGIQFEYYANADPRYRRLFEQSYQYDRFSGSLWHSRLDKELRINAVIENRYIFRRLLPAGVEVDSLTREERILLEHTTPVFNMVKLRSAQEMVSCEGFAASVFHAILQNGQIRNRYLQKAFYRPFLRMDIPESSAPEDLFIPFENVILKTFHVWKTMSVRKKMANPPLIEFIQTWCREFPDDKKQIISIFIGLSAGKSVSENMGNIFERMAYWGTIGNSAEFRKAGNRYINEFLAVRKKVMTDMTALTGNIGPELWITHDRFTIRSTLWNENPRKLLRINLNTASVCEVAVWLGQKQAENFIEKRDRIGYFTSMGEIRSYGFNFKDSGN